MNNTIKELEKQIEIEKRKISNCTHEFNKSFYNPEEITESYGYKLVGRGSDVWGEPEGYRKVKKDRWTRVCKKCGYEEHTYNQKPVISSYEPSFNN